MIRHLISIVFYFWSTIAVAAPPPVSIKGQNGSKMLPKWNLQVPGNQATNLGGIDALIETGNKNILQNPGFEAIDPTQGWSLASGVTAAPDTSSKVGETSKQSLKLSLSAVTGAIIDQVLDITTDQSGINMEFSIWVKTSQSGLKWCLRRSGSDLSCADISSGNTWNKYTLNYPGLPTGTSILRLSAGSSTTGDVLIDDAYSGLALNIGTVAQGGVRVSAIRITSAQTISSASATRVVFNNVANPYFNTHGEMDTSTGAITVKKAGRAFITARLALVGATLTASQEYTGRIRKNGVSVCGGIYAALNGTVPLVEPSNCSFDVSVGDVIDVSVESGGDTSYDVSNSSQTYLTYTLFPAPSEIISQENQADLLNTFFSVDSGQCPVNSLELNGGTIPSQYAALIARRGSSTLPDLRGSILRMTGTGTISGRSKVGPSVGAFQEDRMQGHAHGVSDPGHNHIPVSSAGGSPSSANANYTWPSASAAYTDFGSRTSTSTTGITVSGPTTAGDGTPRTGSDTRPYNYGVRNCVWAASNPFVVTENSVRSLDNPGVTTINTIAVISSSGAVPDTADTIYCNSSGGDVTLTFPPAASSRGRPIRVIKTPAANKCILDGNASELFGWNGGSSLTATLHLNLQTVEVVTAGTSWTVIRMENDKFKLRTQRTTTQTVNHNEATRVLFNNVPNDTHGIYSTGTGGATIPADAKCSSSARTQFDAAASVGTIYTRIMRESEVLDDGFVITDATNTSRSSASDIEVFDVFRGNTVFVNTFQNTKSPNNTLVASASGNQWTLSCEARLW